MLGSAPCVRILKALDCPSCSTGSHTGWRSCDRCASDHHEHCVQTHPKHTPNAPSQGSPVFATLDATVSGVESHEQAEWEKGFWKVPLQHASSASSVSVSCRELPCCYQGACEWCGWDWCGGNCRNCQRSALSKSRTILMAHRSIMNKCFLWLSQAQYIYIYIILYIYYIYIYYIYNILIIYIIYIYITYIMFEHAEEIGQPI